MGAGVNASSVSGMKANVGVNASIIQRIKSDVGVNASSVPDMKGVRESMSLASRA